MAISLAVLVFGVIELSLRLAGVGFDPHFFKRERVGGRDCYVANEDFGLRFFPRSQVRFPPPLVMPTTKASNTFRIFIFGESAAMGDPRPNYGAGSYLEVLLTERFPGTKFEVVNTSMTAINSHVILPIAKECAAHTGDLWIVYMGNNEMVGPFGGATVFGIRAPPLWLVRAHFQMGRLRFAQLLTEASEKVRKNGPVAGWQGMEMFVQNQLSPDDPRKQRVYESFERNLDDILEAGLGSGAKIVLSTVAVNLKDCAPFGSVPDTHLAPGSREAFAKFSQDGATALAQERFEAARVAFEQASMTHLQSAETRFQLATCLLRLTNAPAARTNFVRAVDDDTLPFRADSRINDSIRAAARRLEGKSLVLCDAAEALSVASPDGVPGDELFYEHVHLNPNGNYALALTWATAVTQLLPPSLKRDARPSWVSQTECEQRIGLTDWNRVSILEDILQRLQRPPFSGQSGQPQHVARLQARIAELRQHLTDGAAAQAREVYLRAMRSAPDDFRLHANYAEFLEGRREWDAAVIERKRILELVPNSYFPHYTLGVDLKEAGALAEAQAALLKAIALMPDDPDVRLELGIVAARQGNWEQARQELEMAQRTASGDPRIPLYLGEVLWKLNRRAEALAALRDAIRLGPTDWQPHYRLANNLAEEGNFSEAAAEYREALRLNPTNVRIKLGLAAVMMNLNHASEALQQVDEALQLEPSNRTALELESKIRGK